jgi:hypothetical protein
VRITIKNTTATDASPVCYDRLSTPCGIAGHKSTGAKAAPPPALFPYTYDGDQRLHRRK